MHSDILDDPQSPEDTQPPLAKRLAGLPQSEIDAMPDDARRALREELLDTYGDQCCLSGCGRVTAEKPLWLDIKLFNRWRRPLAAPNVRIGCCRSHGFVASTTQSIERCV